MSHFEEKKLKDFYLINPFYSWIVYPTKYK